MYAKGLLGKLLGRTCADSSFLLPKRSSTLKRIVSDRNYGYLVEFILWLALWPSSLHGIKCLQAVIIALFRQGIPIKRSHIQCIVKLLCFARFFILVGDCFHLFLCVGLTVAVASEQIYAISFAYVCVCMYV